MVETHGIARPSTQKLLKPLQSQLKAWAETPGLDPVQHDARSLAAKTIQRWAIARKADKRWDDVLALPACGLSSIPPLPKGVRYVDLSGNKMTVLTGLQDLPKSLITLDLSGNPFEQVKMHSFILENWKTQVILGATNLKDDIKKQIRSAVPGVDFRPVPSVLFAASNAPVGLATQLTDEVYGAKHDLVGTQGGIRNVELPSESNSPSQTPIRVYRRLADAADTNGADRPARPSSARSDTVASDQHSAGASIGSSSAGVHTRDLSPVTPRTTTSTLERWRASQPWNASDASTLFRGDTTAFLPGNTPRNSIFRKAPLDKWAAEQSARGGRGMDAVSRIKHWVKAYSADSSHADIPLDLSELGLNELPPELPEGLKHLRFHGNKLIKVPPLHSLPKELKTLDVDGNPIQEFSDDSLNKNRGGLLITIDPHFLLEGEDAHLHFDNSREIGPRYFTPENNLHEALAAWCSRGSDDDVVSRIEVSDRIRDYIAISPNRENEVPLDLSGFGLTSMPPLPTWIKAVNFDNNRLPEIPSLHDLPPKVDLSLFGNPITSLPENFMTTYSAHSDVHISMRPDLLPRDTLAALQRHIAQADYAGPKISFATAYDRNEMPEPAGAKSPETQDPPARQRPPHRPMGPRPMPLHGEKFSKDQASLGDLIVQFPNPPSNGRVEVRHPKFPRQGRNR
ncbi:NEL-type E3 ubiquitin ligase domain-containing protein [Noviherbaspirillum aerium]|uniref:hypothetical protein n=1 Tax=Noviherbaspirillum aerium TaxID=2588497 RepID=UPI00124F73F1|nr:hypothetical protein [Noviherbaspirillum aerium]